MIPSGTLRIREAVLSNLRLLIPEGSIANKHKLNVVGFAVGQLCKVESYADIDWVAVTGLASDISTLLKNGFLD